LRASLTANPGAEDMLAVDPQGAECGSVVVSGDHTALAGQPPPAASGPDGGAGLSTDYLNHYCEVLMLIEMAPFDDAVVRDIGGWRPVGYRDYFARSPLRRAASAIAAYDALPDSERVAFERTVEALDKLTLAAILALQPPCHPHNVVLIGEVIGPAIRRQIDRAGAFLNVGRAVTHGGEDAQAIIDRLIS
jgi:hypothetical protein